MKGHGKLFLFIIGALMGTSFALQRASSRSENVNRLAAFQRLARQRSKFPGRQGVQSSQRQSRKRSRSVARGRSRSTSPSRVAKRQSLGKQGSPSPARPVFKKSSIQDVRARMNEIRRRIRSKREQNPIVGLETVEVDINDVENISEDLFTQSEAHLNEKSVRYLINKNYKVEMYLDIVSQVIAKEQKHKNTHYAFYHALDNVWIATQDVYKKLHEYLYPMTVGVEDFQFLRWGAIGYEGTAQEFVLDQLQNHGLIDDNLGETRAFLLSVNLALFGNVGYPGECTWQYFIHPTSHAQPNKEIFKSILDVFGISHKYIPELMKISDLIKTEEQTLLQILVPIEKVDEIAYLALVRGIPAHDKTIDWVLNNVKSKRYSHVKPVLDKLTNIYKTQSKKNPMFKDLLDQAEKGDFSVNHLLKVYRNTPWKIDNLNYLQARLLLTKDVLLSPDSGVKFLRYSTITRKQKAKYDKALDQLISKIVVEFLSKKEKLN